MRKRHGEGMLRAWRWDEEIRPKRLHTLTGSAYTVSGALSGALLLGVANTASRMGDGR